MVEGTGPKRSGMRHGDRVGRDSYRFVAEGPYVDGEGHGYWVLRNGEDAQERPYNDGKKHGRWVYRNADGETQTITFFNSERQ